MTIRNARLEDAEEILDIYNYYVLNTAITFEIQPPHVDAFRTRIMEISARFPWLVYVSDETILGFAYAGPFKGRCAYAWSVESTVYVREGHHGRRIGTSLYEKMLLLLREQRIVNVIAGIALPNEGSVALHEKFGFRQVARFQEIGYKLEQWWDVGYWQLQLQKPAAVVTPNAHAKEAIAQVGCMGPPR